MSVLERLELSFWHFVIPLIRESGFVRFLLRRFYTLFRQKWLSGFILPASLSAGLGLFIGYIGGLVSSLW